MDIQVIFRANERIKKHAAFRARSEGLSMNKVLSSLLAAYAAGKIKVDISVREIIPPGSLKTRDEMKKMSQSEFYKYTGSLTLEQKEELWERDDAPYITPEWIARLDEDIKKIDSGETKTFGPFETTEELKRALMKNTRQCD